MTKYAFILLGGEKDGFLEELQTLGLMDITRSVKPVDGTSQRLAAEIEGLNGLIQALRNAKLPEGTDPVPCEGDPAGIAGAKLTDLTESRKQLKQIEKDLAESRLWGTYDPETLLKLEEAGVPVHLHKVPAKQFDPAWAEEYALVELARDKSGVRFAVAGPDGLPGGQAAPKDDWRQIEKQRVRTEERVARLEGELLSLKEQIPELEARRNAALSELDLYLAGTAAVPEAENTLVTLVGYAPSDQDDVVTEALDRTGVFYIKEAAAAADNPPIRFRNNKFVKMFEVLTDMYGRPAYDGFDPTPFIAVFFLLFFAFCMGDAGYGLILIGIGLLLRKAESFKDFSPLVVTLGVGTAVIGFLFHTFFSMDIAEWPVFAPVKGIFLPAKIAGYDGTMILALVVGIVHLCLAMVVKTVNETRRKGFSHALGTWGWTLLIVGGVIVGAFALAGVLDKELTRWIIIGIGALSAAGIFLLNDPGRNPLLNIGAGLWESYNTVTGLLGDVLSYLRLYALGLAGSMLGKAFNDIGGMILGDGSKIGLWIPFILIVLVGHTLNIAMAALGAFVHPLRLNFLEFFKNSGYEATGRNYNPLKK